MPNYPLYNLTGKTPAVTYQHLVQHCVESASFVDGLGNEISTSVNISASVYGTASVAITSIFSDVSVFASRAAAATSASWATSSISSSYADQSLSASWAPFTDTGTTLYTGSTYEITSSNAIWASSSHDADNANIANYSYYSGTASYVASASFVSASWASASLSASWAPGDGSGTNLYTGSTYEITSSNSISASWAPFTQVEQISASWASSSLSTSFVHPLYQEVSMFGPTNVGDTTPYTSLYVVGREGWPARIVQGGSFVTQSARPVLYVYRDLDQSQAQLTPLLQLRTFETGSIAPLMVASNDVSDVFTIDYSGSITASGLFGTASNAISASWAPTSITYPLTVLASNLETASIDFLAGQYFQLDTTASVFTFGNSTNATAVRNASVYITPQNVSRIIEFHPSWIVMGNFPTTIAPNSASILSLTTFGSNDASVVAAFASKV